MEHSPATTPLPPGSTARLDPTFGDPTLLDPSLLDEVSTPAPPDTTPEPTPSPPDVSVPVAPEITRPVDEEEPLTVAMIDDSYGMRQRARDIADARLASETQKGGGFRGLLRRVWKGSVANEYYRQKYNNEAMTDLHSQESMFGSNRRASRNHVVNTVDRFTSEYEAETVHREAGERKEMLDDSPEGNLVKSAIKGLINEYALGTLDDEGFNSERLRVLSDLSTTHPQLMGEGLLFADNLLDIAQQVRGRVNAGASLEATLERMKFIVGEASTGVRTEAHLTRADKMVQRLHDTKYGSMVNESTIGLAVGAGLAVAKTLTQKTIGRALAIPGLTGLSTGIFAGLRESKRLKQERAQHGREMAQGGQIDAQSSRRQRMEQFRAETVSVRSLGQDMEGHIGTGSEINQIDSEEQAMELLRSLSEANSRTRLSDLDGIDYMHYSDVTSVEGERTYLDITIARAKIALKRFAEANPDSGIAQAGGVDVVLEDMLGAFQGIQEGRNGLLDAEFNAFRRKTALKAAVVGAAVGAAMGFAMQEGMAHLPGGFGSSHAGVLETPKSGDHKTLLGGLGLSRDAKFDPQLISSSTPTGIHHNVTEHLGIDVPKGWHIKHSGSHLQVLDHDGKSIHNLTLKHDGTLDAKSIAELKGSGDKFTHIVGENPHGSPVELAAGGKGQMILPKDYSLKNIDAAHAVITDPSGKTFPIEYNGDGSLSAHSLDVLQKAGFHTSAQGITVAGPLIDQPTNGNGLVFANGNQTRFVHRTDWYDNKTPKIFDKNELKAWAGGEKGSWFDKDGNVVIDVSHMTRGGSYNNWHSVDPFKANAAGNLHLGISVTKETQAHVFDFKFQTLPNGRVIAVIPKDSPVHQLFQIDAKGHRVYNGKYFEVMQDTGKVSPNGAANVRPLATYVGSENPPGFVAKVPSTEQHTITSLFREPRDTIKIGSPEAYPIPIDTFPIIPIRSRAGLERLERRREYYGHGLLHDDVARREFLREVSPSIRDNPDAVLETGRELAWYRGEIESHNGRDYLDTIDRDIESSPELSSLSPSTRAIVVIPVHGVNESENIEGVLSLYAQQDPAALAETVIMLNVNNSDEEMADPENVAKIDATLEAIERAKARFPQLKVAVIRQEIVEKSLEYTEINEKTGKEEIKKRGKIGHIARRTYDTAMMAVERSMRDGTMAPDHDVLIIRKDADEQGMSRDFLSAYYEKAAKQPETDIFRSLIRWQTEMQRRFPAIGVIQRYATVLDSVKANEARRHGEEDPTKTIGIVFAARMATLASVGSVGFSDYTSAGSDDLILGERIVAARSDVETPARRFGYDGLRRRSVGGRGYSPPPSRSSGSRRVIIDRVPQAEVDTHAGRLKRMYEAGAPVTSAWGDFDNATRTSTFATPVITFDDVARDPQGVASRIAAQISSISSIWADGDRGAAELAMFTNFARNRDRNGNPIYRTVWRGTDCTFEFTPEGEKWLQNRLLRDRRGRFDPVGPRTRRKLYSEVRGGVKTPRRAEDESLMVKAI